MGERGLSTLFCKLTLGRSEIWTERKARVNKGSALLKQDENRTSNKTEQTTMHSKDKINIFLNTKLKQKGEVMSLPFNRYSGRVNIFNQLLRHIYNFRSYIMTTQIYG